MDLKQIILLGLQISIVSIVFGYGLRTKASDLLFVLRRPGLLARSLLSVFVIMPVIAFAIARFFALNDVVGIALVALAISPVPPLLPMKETRAGGQASYGLGLLAVLALLSIPTAPLALAVLERWSDRPLGIDPAAIARIAFVTVLAPIMFGIGVRVMAPRFAERLAGTVSFGAKILLTVAAVTLLAGAWRSVWEAIGQAGLLPIVLFVAAGLAIGHVLGGPVREESVVLGLSTACRHPAIAFTIASANFPEQHFGGAIVLYVLASALIGIPYVRWNGTSIGGNRDIGGSG